MNYKQVKVLTKLNKGPIKAADVAPEEDAVYTFLYSKGYALFLTGRKDEFEYLYYEISEDGKEYLSKFLRELLGLLVGIVALVFTVAGFFR